MEMQDKLEQVELLDRKVVRDGLDSKVQLDSLVHRVQRVFKVKLEVKVLEEPLD